MAVRVFAEDRLPLGRSNHTIIPIGTPFEFLKISSRPFRRQSVPGIYYECECVCGTSTVVRAKSLGPCGVKSCGCHRLKVMKENGKRSRGRKLRNQPRVCLDCGLSEKDVAFPTAGLRCSQCLKERKHSRYMASREERLASEKAAERASPEAFIKSTIETSKMRVRQRNKKKARILLHTINYDYIINLWHKQQGKCAISNIPMAYERHSLYSISIDRIDSELGYVPGNVQLVCKAINFAKSNKSNEDLRSFLNTIINTNRDGLTPTPLSTN